MKTRTEQSGGKFSRERAVLRSHAKYAYAICGWRVAPPPHSTDTAAILRDNITAAKGAAACCGDV